MDERPLVYRVEAFLYPGGAWALAIAFGWRLAFGYIVTHHTWLLHSQLLTVPLLLTALIFCAFTLPRTPGYAATALLGGAAWLIAVSLLPCYAWPRGPLPQWLMWGALVLLGLAWLYRTAKLRRWVTVIRGHGYEWLNTWAAGKPLAARLLADSAMRGQGYQRR
jgi:hypothetical protein